MKKNTAIYRLFSFLLAIVLVLIFSVPTFALEPAQDENTPTAISNNNALEIKEEYTYEEYLADRASVALATESIKTAVNKVVDKEPLNITVNVPVAGMYTFGMSYKLTDDGIGFYEAGLKVNGEYPFAEAEKLDFPRMWKDEAESRKDGLGNEFAAKQKPYDKYYFNLSLDTSKKSDVPYMLDLKAGENQLTIVPIAGTLDLEYIELGFVEKSESYKKPENNQKYYKGESVVIEAEKPYLKNSYWLSSKTDNMSADITPRSSSKSLVNYIGGSNWKTTGETIIWETPELEEGYYQIGFSFRQGAVIGGKVYRKLTIDGKTPFSEAESIGFEYDDNWQTTFASDDKDTPYLIYLSAGKHQIGLSVVPGRTLEVSSNLEEAVAEISSLYIDITMIVGETVDIYRDYDLFSQVPEMEKRLKDISKKLNKASDTLKEITGQESGSSSSVIKNMDLVVNQMLDNRFTAHRYKAEYYKQYTSLASVLYDMKSMPLDIDKIVLTAPGSEDVCEATGFFEKFAFSVEKFVYSFINDYNNISVVEGDKEPVTIWVNWGRDQAQVLNSLIQTSFTEETGIPVNVKLVNASIVQATLSGKGPDCVLQHSRVEPVNLALRGVLYDLTQFDDLDEVLKRFQEGAELPYRYNGGLYALPDTQTFFLMFYRKDILAEMDVDVPETWDEFREATKLLARSNLNVWIPNNTATNLEQISGGVGTLNIFPSLLNQKGLSLYSEDGHSTNLTNMDVMLAFGEWTDMYRKLKIPTAMDFYNRFRTGTCPLGINSYVLYTTLQAAAPEIDGLWGVAPIPGVKNEDGTISHSSAGAGTGCAILKDTDNPKNSWEFLKWWTSASTQLAYSNEVESILGPTGRVAISNVEAFSNMQWDSDMIDSILYAWDQVKEVPEYPGSYYMSRSLYQSFWNVIANNKNPKDMLIKYGEQADMEMARKWKQYENR